nr:MAG TPA: hypothetical protein [Caudoviricetes sp.]
MRSRNVTFDMKAPRRLALFWGVLPRRCVVS